MLAFLDVPENPAVVGADATFTAFRHGGHDGVVAPGGGSVLDTTKFVVALATASVGSAALLGRLLDSARVGVASAERRLAALTGAAFVATMVDRLGTYAAGAGVLARA